MSTPQPISQFPPRCLPAPGSLPAPVRRRMADEQFPVFTPERVTATDRQIFSNDQKAEMIRIYDSPRLYRR